MTSPSLYGTVTLGRLPALFEKFEVTQSSGGALKVSVQASSTVLSTSRVERLRDDLLGLTGKLIPAVWSDKSFLNGFYTVTSVDVTHWSYPGNIAASLRRVFGSAEIELNPSGYANTCDIESRLSGAQTRTNDFSGTGEIWHAPPIGATGYMAGTGTPTIVSRTGEDGAMPVYRGIITGANPRWGATVATFPQGRVRFIDANNDERAGQGVVLNPAGWTLSNALVRVRPLPSGGVLSIDAYTGGAWRTKAWDVLLNAASIAPVDGVDILANDYDTVVLRLFKAVAAGASGRVTVDLTLRRGSRFVELYVQTNTSGTLKVVRAATEAGTNATAGTVVATSNDADSNKYIVGSARTFTADTTIGGLSKASAVFLDAFVGVIAGGTGAVTGDQVAQIYAQYLGATAEEVQPVRR